MRTVRILTCSLILSAACATNAGDEDIASSEDALTAYRIRAATSAPVTAGSNAALTIRVLGAGDVPVTQFDDLHTQPMHVVAVSSNFEDFLHVHPVLQSDGTLSVDVPIALSQPYRFFFEYDPAGPDGEQTSRALLRPVGAQNVAPALASETIFDGSIARTTVTDGTRVTLQAVGHGMIMPQTGTTLRVALTTATGAPVTDLVDWLGMPGHAIVLSENGQTFIHAHGMRPGSGGHGGHGGHGGTGTTPAASNLLDIELTLPNAGLYKMFVQFKRGSSVVTAPFVLRSEAM